jgi:hypothetical protein
MLTKEEKRWLRKNKKIWEKYKTDNSHEEVISEMMNLYRKQSEEIRRDVRKYMKKAWEKDDDENWQEDAVTALQLMGIECEIVSKEKKK